MNEKQQMRLGFAAFAVLGVILFALGFALRAAL